MRYYMVEELAKDVDGYAFSSLGFGLASALTHER